ncbi:MAG: lipopolysaccharide biosynthesis protein [Ignavibacteriaceae bacterium]
MYLIIRSNLFRYNKTLIVPYTLKFMLSNLKYFVKHSIVYSISNVATKAIGVVLLPLYSIFLSISEFGVLGILEITMSIFVEVINLGLGPALVMLNNAQEYSAKKRSALFTIFLTSVFICALFIIAGEITVGYISKYFGDPKDFNLYLRLSIFIIVLRVLNNLMFDKLRADERSTLYTVLSLIKLTVTLGLTIYFVAYAKYSVTGVLYAYILGEGLTFIILFPFISVQMQPRFNPSIMKVAVRFGVPLIFTSIAMMILNVSDRYILKYFANYATLGQYDLGYRIAGVLNMFIIMPISLALMPMAYKMYQKDGDKRYFSKMMTYMTYMLVWAGMSLSFFSKEIIQMFAHNPDYWPAYRVVPVIVFSYVFFGMRMIASIGLYLTKKTKYVAYTTIIAAVVNIALNFVLIPKYGMMAAAYTTLAAFVVLYIISDRIAAKFYNIPFENLKLFFVILLGAGLYIVVYCLPVGYLIDIIIKIILIIAFPFILYLLKFYEPIELERLKGFYSKWKNPANWKNNLSKELKKIE